MIKPVQMMPDLAPKDGDSFEGSLKCSLKGSFKGSTRA